MQKLYQYPYWGTAISESTPMARRVSAQFKTRAAWAGKTNSKILDACCLSDEKVHQHFRPKLYEEITYTRRLSADSGSSINASVSL